jgi:hypothetical protein
MSKLVGKVAVATVASKVSELRSRSILREKTLCSRWTVDRRLANIAGAIPPIAVC